MRLRIGILVIMQGLCFLRHKNCACVILLTIEAAVLFAMALLLMLHALYLLGPGAQDRGRFIDPTAAQRAASLLGVTQDELKHAMFALPGGIRRAAFFHGTTESPSPPGNKANGCCSLLR